MRTRDVEELGRRGLEDEVDNFLIRWDLHILAYRIPSLASRQQ